MRRLTAALAREPLTGEALSGAPDRAPAEETTLDQEMAGPAAVLDAAPESASVREQEQAPLWVRERAAAQAQAPAHSRASRCKAARWNRRAPVLAARTCGARY